LLGPKGASAIFGPQKGADENMVEKLDLGLKNLYTVAKEKTGIDIFTTPGGGAAGGAGAGVVMFLGGVLKPGIELMLNAVKFDLALPGTNLVITGEGRIDGQSVDGKAISGVAKHAKKFDIPVVAIVGGAVDDEISSLYEIGVTSVMTINRLPQSLEDSAPRAKANLGSTIANMMRLIRATSQS
jgi:glycerate kinase